ncbi:pyridoxal phosphate biosynthetic protein [Bdellovibrio sp. qaytius]|nr:pyridoxal phosphate biosynthetic protein [Bdellovibrio sp. qaytius]
MNKTISAVAITTGDPDGIGFEVTAKALAQIGPQKNATFFLFRDEHQEKKQKRYFQLIDQKFSRLTFKSAKAALAFFYILKNGNALDSRFLFDLELSTNAAEWIIEATKLCRDKVFNSLVTAPISKTLIKDAGYKYVGHTGIFRHYFPGYPMFMGFIGEKFNVIIASDHVALKDVEKDLSTKKLTASFLAAKKLQDLLSSGKPVGLLGLNPHAGEKGVVGSFEQKVLLPLVKKYKHLSQPLSPDAAFFPNQWSKYSTYLALYHDQGLIPFKMIHGQDSGVHITLGLPFLRTSVDHGTAKDIFNKNKANANSMREAIELNLQLLRKRRT